MVKKISYFAVLLEGPNTGAAKKVDDQADIWKKMGYQVEIVVLTQENFIMDWNDKSDYKVFHEGNGIGKLIIRYEIIKGILDSKPDILYLRDSFPFVLPRKKTETRIVLEVQSKLQTEVFSRNLALGVLSILLDTFYYDNSKLFYLIFYLKFFEFFI